MGRKPTVNLNLPAGMRAKTTSSGKTYYYLDLGGKPRKWLPLGSSLIDAIKQYASAMHQDAPKHNITFIDVAQRYIRDIIPTKAPRTQKDNMVELGQLEKFFNDPPVPITKIRPIHIRQYLDSRAEAKTRANREIALFSHIYNKAREWGYTDLENPCKGVAKHKESGRAVYVDDATLKTMYDASSQPVRDAIDIAYLTGQRPADVLKMQWSDIKDGALSIKQNKTGAALRIRVEGEFAEVLERIKQNKKTTLPQAAPLPHHIITDERGQPMSVQTLSQRVKRTRNELGLSHTDFQFRDLRAKAATDKEESSGMSAAKDQLGHTSEGMTAHYVRHRKGKLTTPTK